MNHWGRGVSLRPHVFSTYPLVNVNKKLLKMTIEIVDFPIENGDFPLLCKRLPEGNQGKHNTHDMHDTHTHVQDDTHTHSA